MPNPTAKDIVDLLEAKHADDVFVPECKTGQTTSGLLKLDAWAMKRAWSKPVTWGYEIKVSRSDWLRDDKWRGYLDYCSDFYFVTPHKLIQPEELPDGVGLMWVAKTGTRLFTKRKAARRDVRVPEDLYRYVLMSRTTIKANMFDGGDTRASRAEEWRKWLDAKDNMRLIGYRVNRVVADKWARLESDQHVLESKISQFDKLRKLLAERGIDENQVHQYGGPEQIADKLSGWPGRDVIREVRRLRACLDAALERVEPSEQHEAA